MIKKGSRCIQYLDFNNQYGQDFSQSIPYGGFEYVADVSMFTEDFIRNCNSDFDCTLIVHYALIIH